MKRIRRRLPRLLRFLMSLIRLLAIPSNFHHLMLTSIKFSMRLRSIKNGSACTSISSATKVLHSKQSFNFKHLCSLFNHLMKFLPIKYLLLCAYYLLLYFSSVVFICFMFFVFLNLFQSIFLACQSSPWYFGRVGLFNFM